MRRTLGAGAGVLVAAAAAAVLAGPGAQAQTFDLYPGVIVTPSVVSSPDTEIIVSGPRFPNGEGCAAGAVVAVPAGQPLSQALAFVVGADLNGTGGEPGPGETWSFGRPASDLPFGSGEHKIFLNCSEQGATETYATDATFTIAPTATTTTTSSTTPTPGSGTPTTSSGAPGGTAVTVEPSTAKPGATTLTVRGGGFKAGGALQIDLGTSPATALGTTTASPTGSYSTTLKLPVSAPPGRQQLLVTGPALGNGATRSTTATLTVVDLSCADFATSEEAQAALGAGDPHGLDADGDGVACEEGGTASASGTTSRGRAVASGSLAATGTRHVPAAVVGGLTALTVGALLVGLSHPSVVAPGADQRRRRRGPYRP